jgi:hypothetical protein
MSSDKTATETTKHFQMEPFQIFSFHRRAEVAQQNPGLSNSQLISKLGEMWRELSPVEKEQYMVLALNVPPANRPTRPRKLPQHPELQADAPPSIHETPQTLIERVSQCKECPQFAIIPRGSSGTQAAMASHQVMFPDKPYWDQQTPPGMGELAPFF